MQMQTIGRRHVRGCSRLFVKSLKMFVISRNRPGSAHLWCFWAFELISHYSDPALSVFLSVGPAANHGGTHDTQRILPRESPVRSQRDDGTPLDRPHQPVRARQAWGAEACKTRQ